MGTRSRPSSRLVTCWGCSGDSGGVSNLVTTRLSELALIVGQFVIVQNSRGVRTRGKTDTIVGPAGDCAASPFLARPSVDRCRWSRNTELANGRYYLMRLGCVRGVDLFRAWERAHNMYPFVVRPWVYHRSATDDLWAGVTAESLTTRHTSWVLTR